MKHVTFGLAAGVMLLITVFCVTTTVRGREAGYRVEKHYLAVKEQEYREQVREILEKDGYYNCGITMSKTYEPKGILHYEVKLHHRKFSHFQQKEEKNLLRKLQSIPFLESDADFCHEFL